MNSEQTLCADPFLSPPIRTTAGGTLRRAGFEREYAGPDVDESARIVQDVFGGDIETVAGDIEIGADSRIDGGLLVEKPSGWSWGSLH